MTLWIVTILAALAVAIGRYLSLEVRLTKYALARAQAAALARSGVYLAMDRLTRDLAGPVEGVDWLEDDWSSPADHPWVVPWTANAIPEQQPEAQSSARVEVVVTDEERRLDLNSNTASVEALRELVGDSDMLQPIVDDRDPTEDPPAVEDHPEVPYYAKNGPIRVPEELLEIPEVRRMTQENPAAIATLWRETTTFSEGNVNMNTASEPVLRAVKLHTTLAGLIQRFVQQRGAGNDGALGGGDDCLRTGDPGTLVTLENCLQASPTDIANLTANLGYQSNVFRIVATGVADRPSVRSRLEAVVKRTDATERPSVLAWREGDAYPPDR